jgi:hypothetical protein
VSGYGLDDRAIEVRSPAEAKGFFLESLCPDLLCGPHSLLSNGHRESFSGVKAWPGCDHSPPSSAEVKKSRSLASESSCGTALLFFLLLQSLPISVPCSQVCITDNLLCTRMIGTSRRLIQDITFTEKDVQRKYDLITS